jgi:hypothetical protein
MPAVVKWAGAVMIAGAVLTATLGGFVTASWDHPSGDIRSGVPGLVFGIFWTAAGCVPWLWTTSIALAGRGSSRVLSWVFFVGYLVSFVPSLVVSSNARFGSHPSPALVAEVGLELLVGLAAIVLLWQPASGRYFSASKEARHRRAEARAKTTARAGSHRLGS